MVPCFPAKWSERRNVRLLISLTGTGDLSHWIVEGMDDVCLLKLALSHFSANWCSENGWMQGEA
jgi:hypothetical protein